VLAVRSDAIGADSAGGFSVRVDKPLGGTKTFGGLDGALGPAASQAEMFEACGAPAVRACLSGMSGAVLAYGQTGGGKTFTVFGPAAGDGDGVGDGLLARSVRGLFESLEAERAAAPSGVWWRVDVSMVQLYQGRTQDLLCEDVLQSSGRAAACIRVASAEHALEALSRGVAARTTAPTGMNARSSRSHCLVTLSVAVTRAARGSGKGEQTLGRLSVVDLAGSERAHRASSRGTRLAEACTINRGVAALGNVIHALARRASHVPWRDSALTSMLRPLLGAGSTACLVLCLSPAAAHASETSASLELGARAARVRQRPSRQRSTTVVDASALDRDAAEAAATAIAPRSSSAPRLARRQAQGGRTARRRRASAASVASAGYSRQAAATARGTISRGRSGSDASAEAAITARRAAQLAATTPVDPGHGAVLTSRTRWRHIRGGADSHAAQAAWRGTESRRAAASPPRPGFASPSPADAPDDDDDDCMSVAGSVAVPRTTPLDGARTLVSSARQASRLAPLVFASPGIPTRAKDLSLPSQPSAVSARASAAVAEPSHEETHSSDATTAVAALEDLVRSQQAIMESQRRRIRWLEQRQGAAAAARPAASPRRLSGGPLAVLAGGPSGLKQSDSSPRRPRTSVLASSRNGMASSASKAAAARAAALHQLLGEL